MGPTALLPLRRKACWGFFRSKNPTASAGFEPANLGTKGQHATSRPPKLLRLSLDKYLLEQEILQSNFAEKYDAHFFYVQCTEQILYPTEFPPTVSVFEVIKHSREGAAELLFYVYSRWIMLFRIPWRNKLKNFENATVWILIHKSHSGTEGEQKIFGKVGFEADSRLSDNLLFTLVASPVLPGIPHGLSFLPTHCSVYCPSR